MMAMQGHPADEVTRKEWVSLGEVAQNSPAAIVALTPEALRKAEEGKKWTTRDDRRCSDAILGVGSVVFVHFHQVSCLS